VIKIRLYGLNRGSSTGFLDFQSSIYIPGKGEERKKSSSAGFVLIVTRCVASRRDNNIFDTAMALNKVGK
jgi:hypothetical protein